MTENITSTTLSPDNTFLGVETHLIDPFIQAGSLIFLQQIIELIYYPFDTWKTCSQYKTIYGFRNNLNVTPNLFRGLLITMLTPTLLIFTSVFVCVGVPLNYFINSFQYSQGRSYVFSAVVIVVSLLLTNAVIVPRELIKILIQLNQMPSAPLKIIREIKRKDGWKQGVFRGFWITLVINSIDIFHNTLLMRILIFEEFPELQINIWVFVSFCAVLLIIPPLDLTKTTIQIHETATTAINTCDDFNYDRLSCVTEQNKSNPFKILWCVYKKKGFFGLFAGFKSMIIRILLIAGTLVMFILTTRNWYWSSYMEISWIKRAYISQ